MKHELKALAFAMGDYRVPLLARIILILAIGYAASPIDLIPDFIPLLGMLDDLIILPLLITLAIKLIPKDVLDEYRKRAQSGEQFSKTAKWSVAIFIIVLWAGVIAALVFWILDLTGVI
ncbi:MAG: DUF1232 domain-containing protein [Spirochaetaceae bacterium]|nr:MAG: DUF1232 domain-containing protein [Spirochaetaceae bacterium]